VDEVIEIFNRNHVRYLLIGGQALRLEGMPRFSMDWDFYVPPHDARNLRTINKALGDELDLPLLPLGKKGENSVQTYQTRWGIIQFHMGGAGLPDFDQAERNAARHRTESGTEVLCLCGRDLLASKKAANRPQDQDDIRFLERKAEAGLL
jgi:hypothetical protein